MLSKRLLVRTLPPHFRDSSVPHSDLQLYKAIAESLRKGIIIVDNEDIILFINKELCQLLEYEEQELLGKYAAETFLGKEKAKKQKAKLKDRQQGKSEEYEVSAFTKSGRQVLLNIYGSPLYDKEGKVWGSIGFHNDLTQIKKYQEDLKETLDQRNKLITNIREAFFSIDMVTRKHILLSEAHEEIYGYPMEAFYTNPNLWFEVIHPDDKALVREGMALLAKGEVTYDEHRIIRKDGTIVWVEGRVTPTLNEQGELIRLDGLVANITKRKKAESRLKEKINDLNTFIYKSSHDLGAPLASMLGLIHLAKDKNTDTEVDEYLGMVVSTLNKMNGLLKDLVSSTRITEDTLIIEPVDLQAMIEEVMDSLKFSPGFDDIDFKLEVSKNLQIQSDRRFIYPILSNLIVNAMKYRRSMHGAFIHLSVMGDHKGITLLVEDNGIGIPEELHDKVFDMFYRGTQASTGSGLGLYIAKTAVQKLNGTIKLESEVRKGSRFLVYLPSLQSGV